MAGGVGGDVQSPKKRKREQSEGKTKPTRPSQVEGGGAGTKRKGYPAAAHVAHGGAGEAAVNYKRPHTAKEKRLAAKDMSEARKMKRKRYYSLEKELTKLWEKMRCHDVSKEERSKLVSEALRKMDGKYSDIAGSHVTARVLQTCVKRCTQSERDAIFDALKPDFLILSRKKYAVFLIKKLIELATKEQFASLISSLHGKIAKLLPHTIGAAVVDYAFRKATQPQKRQLLLELYSTELQLFKDLTLQKSHSLLETITKLGLQKSSVLHYMTIVIHKILEKGNVEYSIVHTVILEYFTIADKTSASDVICQLIPLLTQGSTIIDGDGDEPSIAHDLAKKTKAKKKRLSEPLIIRIMQTKEGLKLGISCLKHGSAKDRKKIIKSVKGHIMKLALHDFGSLFLISIISIVDDTKLVSKVVIQELAKHMKQLILDKNGRRPLLQLLHPFCSRYLPPSDLAYLNYNVPSLSSKKVEASSESTTEVKTENSEDVVTAEKSDGLEGTQIVSDSKESKKDPSQRQHELLIESGTTKVKTENSEDAVTAEKSDGLEGTQIVSESKESKKDPSQRQHELLIESGTTKVKTENSEDAVTAEKSDGLEGMQIVSESKESKKDPSQRQHELLIKSELAEALVQSCIENAEELLRTNFGKDILYEVAIGGKDNVLESITDRIHKLHDVIASDAARPKREDTEHAFENFHSSRIIRRLIIDSPEFAVTLWKKSLKGKCKIWADGHSSKVVAAFLVSPSSKVRDIAKPELQPLIDSGVLKIPDHGPFKHL